MPITLARKPEPIHTILARSLVLYRQAFRTVFLLALTFSIVAFIPRLITLAIGNDIFTEISLWNINNIWLVAIDLACLILFTAMLWRVRCIIYDMHEKISDDLKIALKKIPYILVAVILQSLLILIITFCLVGVALYVGFHHNQPLSLLASPPELLTGVILISQFVLTIYIFFALYFYLAMILVENEGILDSLLKSAKLAWGNWWQIFVVQITPWATYLFSLILIKYLLNINIHIYFIEPGPQQSPLGTFIHILLLTLIIPWVACTLLVQLRDLEVRKTKGNLPADAL